MRKINLIIRYTEHHFGAEVGDSYATYQASVNGYVLATGRDRETVTREAIDKIINVTIEKVEPDQIKPKLKIEWVGDRMMFVAE